MLRERNLITDTEVATVSKFAEIGFEAGAGKRDAKAAYFASRELHNTLLASGEASPVALVLASSAVGSYTITENPDGTGGVIFAKSGGGWEIRGTTAGAVIGGLFGPEGAAIGGLVGGLVGHAVDECTK